MFLLLTTIIGTITTIPVYGQSYKEVTMSVGETQTFYLPSSVTSKDLKSVTFYSNGISYVQVTSYTNYSVTVKAIKAFSSPIIVRCDYRYFVRSGSFTYETSGAYDYRITVASSGGGGSGVAPTSIRFSSSAVGLSVGESRQLTPTVLPANAEYTLTWSINDTSVASISQDGLLVGKSTGEADLKVKADNGIYAMLRVVVSKPTPTRVTISPSSVTLTEGQSRYLTATVYPSNASQSVTWTSSNANIASVSSIGKVMAVKAGTAVITAKTSNGKSATCSVTCKAAIPDLTISDKDGITNLPEKANVTYERTFYTGWNSVCVPFALSQSMLNGFASRCKIATVAELEVVGNIYSLSVNEVQAVSAGAPCLVYAPKDVVCKFSLSNVALRASPDNSSKLQGAYSRTVIGSGLYKLTADGSAIGITESDDAIVAPFRAYIRIENTPQTRRCISAPIEIKLTQVKSVTIKNSQL
jgi:hypothetical protein